MANYTCTLHGDFKTIRNTIVNGVLDASISTTLEETFLDTLKAVAEKL